MADWTVARLLAVSADYLAGKGSSSPRLDAELLLAESLSVQRIDLYVQHDRPLTSAEIDAYRELIVRRAKHEPVAYILGRASFRYLTLEVGPDALIPRPETEELVDVVLAWLRTRPMLPSGATESAPPAALIADVGTGSGAIALSLAAETGLPVLGLDVSAAALALAERNRDALHLSELVELRATDLLDGVPDRSLRLVVSNPPYVSSGEYACLEPGVREFEPAVALLAGVDGLDAYRRLLPQAARALGPGGAVVLEVGDGQADPVVDLALAAGLCRPAVTTDLSGKRRIVRAVRPGALVLPVDPPPSPGVASPLRAALAAGAIVGLPTDTVYGLAAAWDSAPGVRELYSAKVRGEQSPVAVVFASVAALRESLPDLDAPSVRVLEALLPGPFTFVVATSVPRPPLVGTRDSLGVRVPDHPRLLALLDSLGTAVAATSANISGAPAPASLLDVDPEVLAACAAAFGDTPREPAVRGIASTVVDLRPLGRGETPTVLREGAVGAVEVLARIAAAVGA